LFSPLINFYKKDKNSMIKSIVFHIVFFILSKELADDTSSDEV